MHPKIVCLKEDIIVVLPKGFGNSAIYSPEHSRKKINRFTSTDSKMFVVIWNIFGSNKRADPTEQNLESPQSAAGNQPSLTEKLDIV